MVESHSPSPEAPRPSRRVQLHAYLRRLVWLGMLPLGLVAIFFGVASVRQVQQDDEEIAERLTHEVAYAIEQSLRGRVATMTVLARTPLLEGEEHLRDFHRLSQGFLETWGSDLVLGDSQGRMLMHSSRPLGAPLPPLTRPRGRGAVSTAMATGVPAVGDIFIGPVSPEEFVAVAVPVPGEGPSDHALSTAVPIRHFQYMLDRQQLPEGWVMSVYDSQRRLMARQPASLAQATLAPTAGTLRRTETLVITPWTVEVSVPAVSRWAPVHRATLLVVAGIAIAAMVGVWVATWAGRRLAGEMRALAEARPQSDHESAIEEIAAAQRMLVDNMRARDEASEALRRSEATFRAMFEGLYDAVVLTDPQRVIRLVNPAFTTMFGYAAEDVIGLNTEFLYVDDDDYAAAARHYANAAPGVHTVFQLRYRRRNGGTFWAESVGLRIAEPDGRPLGFLGLHRDITDRKRDQDQLRLSQQMFASAFANNPAAIALSALESSEILDVNASWLALTGETRESILGQASASR